MPRISINASKLKNQYKSPLKYVALLWFNNVSTLGNTERKKSKLNSNWVGLPAVNVQRFEYKITKEWWLNHYEYVVL